MGVTPISRTSVRVGKHKFRAFGPGGWKFYKDATGALNPISMVQERVHVPSVGDMLIRRHNVVATGVRTDGSTTKYAGLRPDFCQNEGTQQFEFSVESFELDGKHQELNVVPVQTWDDMTISSAVAIQQCRNRMRQMFMPDKPSKSFRGILHLNLVGMTIVGRPELNEYWIYAGDEFRFRILPPSLIDPNTGQPFQFYEDNGEPSTNRQILHHSLIPLGNKQFLYIKESGEDWEWALEQIGDAPYWIDLETVYSSTTDGFLYKSGWPQNWSELYIGSANMAVTTYPTSESALNVYYNAGNGYGLIGRTYLYFDMSGLEGQIESGSINICGYGTNTLPNDFRCVESTQETPLSSFDWEWNTTDISITEATNLYTEVFAAAPLNANGITWVENALGGTLKLAVRNYTFDILVVQPGVSPVRGIYFAESANAPFVEITLTEGNDFTPQCLSVS